MTRNERHIKLRDRLNELAGLGWVGEWRYAMAADSVQIESAHGGLLTTLTLDEAERFANSFPGCKLHTQPAVCRFI